MRNGPSSLKAGAAISNAPSQGGDDDWRQLKTRLAPSRSHARRLKQRPDIGS